MTALPFFLVTLAVVPFCFSQTPAESIPAKWLHDGRLVVPEFNFSIHSPNPDWKWTYQQFPDVQGSKTTGFIVEVADDEKYMVIIWENGGDESMTGDTEKFAAGMKKTLPKDWQIRNVQAQPTNVPMSGTSNITVWLQRPDKSTLYAHNYIVSGKHTYTLVGYSQEATEPPQFSRFVASFALISRSANALPAKPAKPPTAGILILLAIWGAIVDWGYVRRGGVKPTRNDKFGLLAAIGLCVGVIVLLIFLEAPAGTLGELTGLLLIVIFALWEFARWRIRRKNPIAKIPKAVTVGT